MSGTAIIVCTWYTDQCTRYLVQKTGYNTGQTTECKSEEIADTSTNYATNQSINQETDDTDKANMKDTGSLTVDNEDTDSLR